MTAPKAEKPTLYQGDAERERRWNEINRLRTTLGWGLQTLAERLGVTYPVIYDIKLNRRELGDSDLLWLRELAAFQESHPRPAEQFFAGIVQPPAQEWTPPPIVMSADLPPVPRMPSNPPRTAQADEPQQEVVEVVEVEAVIAKLAEVYAEAGQLGMPANQSGARWAVAELADKLGLLDRVKAHIKAAQSAKAA